MAQGSYLFSVFQKINLPFPLGPPSFIKTPSGAFLQLAPPFHLKSQRYSYQSWPTLARITLKKSHKAPLLFQNSMSISCNSELSTDEVSWEMPSDWPILSSTDHVRLLLKISCLRQTRHWCRVPQKHLPWWHLQGQKVNCITRSKGLIFNHGLYVLDYRADGWKTAFYWEEWNRSSLACERVRVSQKEWPILPRERRSLLRSWEQPWKETGKRFTPGGLATGPKDRLGLHDSQWQWFSGHRWWG